MPSSARARGNSDKKGDQVATKPGGKTPRRAAAGSNDAPLRRLVVVESPAKARTIGRYLGEGYTVEVPATVDESAPKKYGCVLRTATPWALYWVSLTT